ncbi:MAG: hypothetical protein RL660_2952 [Bacteroidota bacterium]|jgi:hypothetical protein
MKKVTLILAFALVATTSFAQVAKDKKAPKKATPAAKSNVRDVPAAAPTKTAPVTAAPTQPAPPQTATPATDIDKFAKFDKLEHDFGKVPEGPQATTEFKVKNISNEPLTISNVQASCGCTVPNWTKEAIPPGETGTIKAIYNTQGRPGNIYKTLTVTTNAGTKVLTLKGNVEKAPDTSVPAPAQGTMIKN